MRRKFTPCVCLLLLFLGLASGAPLAYAQAAQQATVQLQLKITTGGMSIVSNGGVIDFGSVSIASGGQSVAASSVMTLTVVDASGAARGWNVTFQSTDLTDGTGVIAANPNIRFNPSGGTITTIGGQAVDASNGPRETNIGSQALGSPVRVLTANPGFGAGSYRYTPLASNLSLTVPSGLQIGTGSFSGTLTASVSSGP